MVKTKLGASGCNSLARENQRGEKEEEETPQNYPHHINTYVIKLKSIIIIIIIIRTINLHSYFLEL